MSNYLYDNKTKLDRMVDNDLNSDESLEIMKELHNYYKTTGFDEDFCLLNQDQRNQNVDQYEKFSLSINEGINEIIYDKYKLNSTFNDEESIFNRADLSKHDCPSLNFNDLNINKFVNYINNTLADYDVDEERKQEIGYYAYRVMTVLSFTIGSNFTEEYYSTYNVTEDTVYEPFASNFYSLCSILSEFKNLKLVNVMDETHMCDKIFIGSILLNIYKHSEDYLNLFDETVKIWDWLSETNIDFGDKYLKEFHETLLIELGEFIEIIPKWFDGVTFRKKDMETLKTESSKDKTLMPFDLIKYHSAIEMYKLVGKFQLSSNEIPQTVYFNLTQLDGRDIKYIDILNKHLANLFNIYLNLPDSPTDNDYKRMYKKLIENFDYQQTIDNFIEEEPPFRVDGYSKSITYLHDGFFQFNNPVWNLFTDDEYAYHHNLYNKSPLYQSSYNDRYKDLDSYNQHHGTVTFGHRLLSDRYNTYQEMMYNLFNGLRNYTTNEGLMYGYGSEQVQNIIDTFTTIQNNMLNDNLVNYKSYVNEQESLNIFTTWVDINSIELIDIPCKGNNNKLKIKYNHSLVEVTEDDVKQINKENV